LNCRSASKGADAIFRIPAPLRVAVERLSRGVVLRRRLPADLGGHGRLGRGCRAWPVCVRRCGPRRPCRRGRGRRVDVEHTEVLVLRGGAGVSSRPRRPGTRRRGRSAQPEEVTALLLSLGYTHHDMDDGCRPVRRVTFTPALPRVA
jgi:hypothetical protein